MLKRICLRSWRNIQYLPIELDKNINVVTGNVGCGKTNVLRGIAEISQVLTNNNIIKIDDFGRPLEFNNNKINEIKYTFKLTRDSGNIEYTLGQESNKIIYENLDYRYSDVLEQYDVLALKDSKVSRSTLPRCKNLNTNLKSDISLVKYIKYNTISSEHGFDRAFDEFYEFVNGIYYTDLSDDYLDEAVEFIGKYDLTSTFNEILKEFNIKLDLEYDERRQDMTIGLNNEKVGFKLIASYGVKKLAILFRLLYRDLVILNYRTKEQRYTTLLIDNFDLGLNRMIVEKLMRMFKQRNMQVILSISDINLGLSYIESRPNIIYIGDYNERNI